MLRPGQHSQFVAGHSDSSTDRTSSRPESRPRKDMATVRPSRQDASRPSTTSRIPQAPSQRRPSLPGQGSRPPLTHQNQSWNSVSSTVSSRSASQTAIPSASPPAKLADPRTKSPRNVLRRKSANWFQGPANPQPDSSHSSSERGSGSSGEARSQATPDSSASHTLDRFITASPMEIQVAQAVELPATSAHTVTIYPELDRYRDVRPFATPDGLGLDLPYKLSTQDLPPPTPLFSGTSSQLSGFSGSPSTRFSESPGPGPYSRDTTPTSISSQSPCLVAPIRTPGPRTIKHSSPAQVRQRRGTNEEDEITKANLSTIRELSTSSSSNSTVRAEDRKEKTKKKRLSPPPPSPPPRKSSQKFKASPQKDASPASKQVRGKSQPFPISPPPQASPAPRQKPVTSPRATPPIRPSRDGTPDLHSQFGFPLPVIHSNLSSSSFTENRRTSVGPAPPSAGSRSVTPASASNVDRPQISSKAPRGKEAASSREIPQPQAQEAGRTTRTPSPSVSTFRTRFPLFGRRTKTTSDIPQVDKKEKKARKGPAAGTGHEGYGRIGSHRRRSSTSGSGSRELPGSSQESLSSVQSHDPFLLERMNPIVISSGEVIENRNTSSELSRTESNQSLPFGRPSVDSRNDSQVSLSSRDGRQTLWPSAFPRGTTTASSIGSRRPSDSSDFEGVAMRSTLAFRRSMQRLNQAPDQPQIRLPKPIVVRPPQGIPQPSISSLDTAIMSDDSIMEPAPEPVRGRKEATAPKKLTKRTRSPRKWNLFGRSQSQPAVAQQQPKAATRVATSVKVVQVKQEPKPVAFYTMMDSSEQEDDVDIPAVQNILREAQVLHLPPKETIESRGVSPSVEGRLPRQRSNSAVPSLARSAELPRRQGSEGTDSPQLSNPAQDRADRTESSPPRPGRPSRLPQVGRIPKVISARPEQTSSKSFSRPFNRISLQLPPQTSVVVDTDSLAKGPSPPKPSTPELTRDGSTATVDTTDSDGHRAPPAGYSLANNPIANEFLRFSPRKGSQDTACTTSSSSGMLSYADTTAIIRDAHAPLVEDEIWDEYNDLLGEESLKVPPSAGSSQGVPFHLEGYGRRLAKEEGKPLESPVYAPPPNPAKSVDAMMAEKPLATSSIYEAEVVSKLNEAIDQDANPLTPFSVGEFVSGYGDRNISGDLSQMSKRNSGASTGTKRRSRASTTSSCSQSSEDNSPLSQVNLRVGSMTVSKWLTFGHVLFSPARDELVPVIGSLKRHSILVIDGLGNDDWSFYAAETYPAATFFNLSPRAPLPAEHKSAAAFPLSPPNHHQIQYTSHAHRFPFAPESFTSVVFRFPAAAPEAHYRNVVSEARRVLRPGGYLELSILDLDLHNMGPRTRRAVRALKERIHARSPETSIGSCADAIVRMLAARGFSDVKSCRVGVPVASPIARRPSDVGKEGPAATAAAAAARTAAGKDNKGKRRPKKDDRSLAEMMSDESPVADESITNMVAKVGRWWHARCYEGSAANVGAIAGSIWNDRSLLAECEEWATSLKLTVCYARVPDVKRVASI
ncbi:uncharacterized protein E0L32_009808 [Thyridium curvatum]|uniref:Methyltransferase type 11 domain-containing protein n=1 Tax=Thyridium curvatum TaxID=1093900 RepID=A0A507APU1_9PEZI|nr:uncharacterized protein E0L32_009808 [Thyridium curvatum]TPX08746.1 hypothetical protein E0L32_009808 [Thyridium curvatum]